MKGVRESQDENLGFAPGAVQGVNQTEVRQPPFPEWSKSGRRQGVKEALHCQQQAPYKRLQLEKQLREDAIIQK